MSSQEEHNKLTDEEKLKLIEFYEENSELWVTQGITRSQKALKKEELVEEFDRKFLIEILEKAFHAVRASFLRDHKKYQKEEKLPNKGWKFYESVFFLKNETQTSEKPCIYGTTDKICCGKIAAVICCVWMKNSACGPWALMLYYLNVALSAVPPFNVVLLMLDYFKAPLFHVALFDVALLWYCTINVALYQCPTIWSWTS